VTRDVCAENSLVNITGTCDMGNKKILHWEFHSPDSAQLGVVHKLVQDY
jgi:hypothetical protein